MYVMVSQLVETRAASRKVAGSIPDVVTGDFHGLKLSVRNMILGSTHLLIEMSTRDTSWGVKAVGG